MIVRKLRLEKGWSQEQLAELCDLSVRTIQRIERGQKPSLESLKALASVFELDVSELSGAAGASGPSGVSDSTDSSQLSGETDMTNQAALSEEEEKAIIYVRDIKGFYSHLIKYAVVISFLFIINIINSPGYFWVIWPALGWGIGVACHGLNVFEVFNLFGPDWEKRQVEKRLNKKP